MVAYSAYWCAAFCVAGKGRVKLQLCTCKGKEAPLNDWTKC